MAPPRAKKSNALLFMVETVLELVVRSGALKMTYMQMTDMFQVSE